MKLVFVHDGPLFYDKDGNYYEFAYRGLYERYSYLADEITFLIRTKPVDNNRKYTKVPKQINIISVPEFKNIRCLKNIKYAKKIIEKTIKETDYVVFRLQSSIAYFGLKYAKKYNKPYIIESVGCPFDSYWNHSLFGKIVAPFSYLSNKKAIKEGKYIYYVTSEFLQKRYPTKGISVSCSNVVLPNTDDSVLENRLNKIKNMKNRSIVLGTAAAIDVRYKGQEYVIKAIAQLNKEGYDFVYKLAGGFTGQKNDTYLADLIKKYKVEDKVIFMGSLSADKMNEYYDSLDIYIQPSKQEGLPRAVIEAMSRACPCIGTNIAGIPELIRHDLLFPKGNYKSVVKILKYILCCDLSEISKENFEKSKQYEIVKLTERRNDFYDKFLNDLSNNPSLFKK